MSLKNSKEQHGFGCNSEDCVILVFQSQNSKERVSEPAATIEASVRKPSTAEEPATNMTEVLTLQVHLVCVVQLQCGMPKMQLLAKNLDKRQFYKVSNQSPEALRPSTAQQQKPNDSQFWI